MSGRGGRWFLLLLLAAPASAATVPGSPPGIAVASTALIENPASWDGRSITFTGEAVGEALVRGDQAWLQVNDNAYQVRHPGDARPLSGYNSSQAIWVPRELARRIYRFGGYHTQGDLVQVIGEFHAACREHGGDMDIHATALEIVREGRVVTQQLNIKRLWIGLGLLAFAGALWLLEVRSVRTP